MNIKLCDLDDKENWIKLNKFYYESELDNRFWYHSSSSAVQELSAAFDAARKNPELITIFMITENSQSIGFVHCRTVFNVLPYGKILALDTLFLLNEFRNNGNEKAIRSYIDLYSKNEGYMGTRLQSELSWNCVALLQFL